MYHLYKKVPKTIEYPNGSKELTEENPFEKPSMLCVAAVDVPKSVFGITKAFMRMAGMRVRGAQGARIDAESFPVSFISMRDDYTDRDNRDKQFVEKYFMPLIMDENSNYSLDRARKNMRNINIMSYCDGTQKIVYLMEEFKRQMEEKGIPVEEIDSILSQIALITFSTDREIRSIGTTTIDFHDINDNEVENNPEHISEHMIDEVEASDIKEKLFINPNAITGEYLISGTGTHTTTQFLYEGKALPIVVSQVVHNTLENSILNSKQDKLIPIAPQVMTEGVGKILSKAAKAKGSVELRIERDETLTYTDARKLTKKECKLLDRIDELSFSYEKANGHQSVQEDTIRRIEKNNTQLKDTIRENSSETVLKKAQLATGWQYSKEEAAEIEAAPSDKETIENQAAQIEKLQSMLTQALDFIDKVRNSIVGHLFFRKGLKTLPSSESAMEEKSEKE